MISPPQRHSHLDALAMTLMVGLCALWGLNQVAAKLANAGISPVLQAGLRSGGSTLLLMIWCRFRGVRLFDADRSLKAGLAAGAMFSAEFALIYWGLEYTPASRAVVFLYTAPFVVALGVHWLVPSERLSRVQSLGLACAFGGILLAFGDNLSLPDHRQMIGDAMLLAAAGLWGGTTVLVRSSRLAAIRPAKTLFYQLGVSAVALPVASLLLGEQGIIGQPSALVWASLAGQIVIVAFASYLTWFWLISRYPATRLSAFSFLTPLFGMMFGAVLLGERITWGLSGAMALVAAGIWLVNRK
ncbi:Permease of the drug/metabolite transporter (DMT) superfamily [Paramagnetospirillum magnetotacticum MS-1]|uniref:Permease of the drug/metabolite transporter (DMT) superfamily n=1 Tax=Paramagnetospirillum magnetotacticum MS-1 TaxID=272627 RepID=A0A0C2UXU2_PARME|nr:DMT family transporter [Paramagnetospirillum magnetotacticum]KIL97621.1 Permease of the drug/metabolite transporter (DMT) superfamily [Paramagnetospirillum magnetotacticum MS-1]